jgi:hypothetical protein
MKILLWNIHLVGKIVEVGTLKVVWIIDREPERGIMIKKVIFQVNAA